MHFDITKWLHTLEHVSARYFLLAGSGFLLFYVLFRGYFIKIKIQKLFPKPKDYYRDIVFSVFSMIIFSTVAYITFTVLKPYNNIYYNSIHKYSIAWYCLSYVWMFFLHDA